MFVGDAGKLGYQIGIVRHSVQRQQSGQAKGGCDPGQTSFHRLDVRDCHLVAGRHVQRRLGPGSQDDLIVLEVRYSRWQEGSQGWSLLRIESGDQGIGHVLSVSGNIIGQVYQGRCRLQMTLPGGLQGGVDHGRLEQKLSAFQTQIGPMLLVEGRHLCTGQLAVAVLVRGLDKRLRHSSFPLGRAQDAVAVAVQFAEETVGTALRIAENQVPIIQGEVPA